VVDFVTGAVQRLVALVVRLNKLGRCLHEAVRGTIFSKELWVHLQLVQCGFCGKENELVQALP